jgi:hypothetical protein
MRLLLSVICLGLLTLFPGGLLADGKDAPGAVWLSKSWNLDVDRLQHINNRFGKGLSWSAGDAICGEENSGYSCSIGGKPYYVVFYEGELGFGFRIAESDTAVRVLGFANCSDNPRVALDKQKIPKTPFPPMNQAFVAPVAFGWKIEDVIKKLGSEVDNDSKDGSQYFLFNWDCRNCRTTMLHIGELEGVQTSLKIGFKAGRVVYYDVSRAWGL